MSAQDATTFAVAVAAPHPAAVDAAGAAVKAGGNALDAALAAAAALTVVYPHQCSIGGDLIALVRRGHLAGDPDRVVAITSAGAAPLEIDVAAIERADRMPGQGATSVTVPGVVAGWMALADMGARLPLGVHLERAAIMADTGVEVSAGLSRALQERSDAVLADEGLRSVFGRAGAVAGPGDVFVQKALARSMRTLAADPDDFYNGGIADRLVSGLRSRGGAHRKSDFSRHRAVVEAPLGIQTAGGDAWVAPPPSQGAVLLGVLPVALAHESTDFELVARCVAAMEVRERVLCDPRSSPVDIAAMLQPEVASGPVHSGTESPETGDTVAITTSDSDGTVVVLIQSVYMSFGSGILEPETGVVLHNRGSAFSNDPSSPARVAPGIRPPHTLCPMVFERDGVALGVGCQGGRAQPWILAQVARGIVRDGGEPSAVLAAPRWVVGGREVGHSTTTVVTEPGCSEAIEGASALGLRVDEQSGLVDVAGHVQVARTLAPRSGETTVDVDAATDPRADGAAAVFTRQRAT